MLFYDAAQQYLEQDRENLAPLTIRTYYWNLRKLQYYRPDLECAEVDDEFVRGFRNHLQQRGDKPATVNKALSVLRIFTNKMMADGLVEGKPFEKIKVGRVYTRRGFLTVRELKSLYLNFLDRRQILTETEQDVMRVFLFSCFTGLRYSDLLSLDSSEIFDWKIRKQMHKTGDPVYVPIPLQARLLLPEKLQAGRVFRVVENSHFNRTLRRAGCDD